MSNLHFRRDSVKFKPARSAATSHVQWGRWGFGGGRGDALLRFARSCKQTVSRNPFRLPRKRERWIQKEALLLRLCLATASRAQFKPRPLYNKAKNNLKWLFFTQESQTRNAKFNQPKFSILKLRVSVRKFKIRSKSFLKTAHFRRRNRCRYVIISRILKSRLV